MLPPSIWLLCLAALGAQAQSSDTDDSDGSVLLVESSTDASTTGTATGSTTSTGSGSSGSSSSSSNRRKGDPYSPITFTQTLETASTTLDNPFTGSEYPYLTYDGQSTVTSTATMTGQNETATTTSSRNSQITRTSDDQSLIGLTRTANATMSSTASSSAAFPMNTQPCNNYPEFCNRQYSNITQVCSHNSAFSIPNNAASNQALPITDQLNDGVRMRK